jgi:hypothetical protein
MPEVFGGAHIITQSREGAKTKKLPDLLLCVFAALRDKKFWGLAS